MSFFLFRTSLFILTWLFDLVLKFRGLVVSFLCVFGFFNVIFSRIYFDVITIEIFMEIIKLFITTSSRVTRTLGGEIVLSVSTFSQFRNSQRPPDRTNNMSPPMNYFAEIPDASGLIVHENNFNNSFKHLFFF